MTNNVVGAAAAVLGGVVGLICVSIFAVILRCVDEKKPADAIKSLTALIGTVLGGGLAEYVVFGRILSTDTALAYYVIGLGIAFLPIGVFVLLDWLR